MERSGAVLSERSAGPSGTSRRLGTFAGRDAPDPGRSGWKTLRLMDSMFFRSPLPVGEVRLRLIDHTVGAAMGSLVEAPRRVALGPTSTRLS